ncbi:hypothetical protein [Bacteroides sp.]|uniref:hypothetical protein n=1 Tax=Bacteroides sp. TaxID=29523 RepID=UPI0026107F5B|nr:hypothetical protein [Bacteroides sp.]MDD3039038.1 hypothetical protein [Bacteroides sp.]
MADKIEIAMINIVIGAFGFAIWMEGFASIAIGILAASVYFQVFAERKGWW